MNEAADKQKKEQKQKVREGKRRQRKGIRRGNNREENKSNRRHPNRRQRKLRKTPEDDSLAKLSFNQLGYTLQQSKLGGLTQV